MTSIVVRKYKNLYWSRMWPTWEGENATDQSDRTGNAHVPERRTGTVGALSGCWCNSTFHVGHIHDMYQFSVVAFPDRFSLPINRNARPSRRFKSKNLRHSDAIKIRRPILIIVIKTKNYFSSRANKLRPSL